MDLFLESKDPIVTVKGKARAEEIALWTPPPGMDGETGKIYWVFDGEAPQPLTEADVAPLREQLKAAMCATQCKNDERLKALEKARAAVLKEEVVTGLIGDKEWETLWDDASTELKRLAAAKKAGRDPVERSYGRDGKILSSGANVGNSRAQTGHVRRVRLREPRSGRGSRSEDFPQRLQFSN